MANRHRETKHPTRPRGPAPAAGRGAPARSKDPVRAGGPGLAGWVVLLALALAGCAGRQRSIPRLAPGQDVDPQLARAASEAEDWQRAAMLWNELFLVGNGDRVTACRETARALLELGDPEAARSVLELGLRRDPDHPALLEAQGDVLARMGFRRAAEAAYRSALEREPGRAHALLELGRIQVDLGRHHQALASLERCLELGSDDSEAYFLHARALAACERPEEAYASFVRAFELGARDPHFLVSAACLAFDERMRASESCRAQSRAWLEQAVDTDPQLTLAHFYLGVLAEERGEGRQALAYYLRAAETDPAHAPSLTHLAVLLHELGDERSAEIARRALVHQNDPAQRDRLKRIVR